MTDARDLRAALGWGLVYFFMGLTGREWYDLPIEERLEAWRWSERDYHEHQ